MDWDDIGYGVFITTCIVIVCLAAVIPICLCVSNWKDRDAEVEKYKIEMELQKELIPKDVLKEDR